MCRLRITYRVCILFTMRPDASEEVHSWDCETEKIQRLYSYDCLNDCKEARVTGNYIIQEKHGPCTYSARKTIETTMSNDRIREIEEGFIVQGYCATELKEVVPHYTDTFLVHDMRDDFECETTRSENVIPSSEESWWAWILIFPDYRFVFPQRPQKYDKILEQMEQERIARDTIEEWETSPFSDSQIE